MTTQDIEQVRNQLQASLDASIAALQAAKVAVKMAEVQFNQVLPWLEKQIEPPKEE